LILIFFFLILEYVENIIIIVTWNASQSIHSTVTQSGLTDWHWIHDFTRMIYRLEIEIWRLELVWINFESQIQQLLVGQEEL
jgi:hypothetical protein